jgi:single-strand DNA-binding protein
MNRVVLTGNVVKDAELTDTKATDKSPNGSKRCAFSLAVNEKYGETRSVCYIPIVVWGSLAATIAEYAKKGARILIDGVLSIRKYAKTDGKKGVMTEVVAERFEVLGKTDGGAEAQEKIAEE